MARMGGSDITASPGQLVARTNTLDMEDGLKATNSQNSKSRIRVRASRLFHFAVGLGEARVVYGHIVFGFLDLDSEAAVRPRKSPAERTFYAVHFAIVGVVDLRGVAAHGGFRVAHHAHQQA